jgi:hypothetical protein
MTDEPAHKLTKGERRLFIAVAVFVVLVGGLSWWWTEIDTNPVVVIPPPPAAPVPNGFDTCVAACNSLIIAGSPAEEAVKDPTAYAKVKLSDAVALVEKNANAILMLRKSFTQKFQEQHERSEKVFYDWHFGYYHMSRFLAFASRTRARQGDHAASLHLALDSMELGQALLHDTPLLETLLGIHCQALGCRQAWDLLPSTDKATAFASAHRLEAMMSAQPADLASVFTEEKYIGQSRLMKIFPTPRTTWNDQLGLDKGLLPTPLALTTNKRESMRLYTAYMDAAISKVRLPRIKRGPELAVPHNVFVVILALNDERAGMKIDGTLCQNRLLMLSFALRAYHAEHAVYPENLGKLVPTYLDSIPDDPFGTGPMRYQRIGKNYNLYSVGFNGVDDGGKPSMSKVLDSSRDGDIVAGVTRW